MANIFKKITVAVKNRTTYRVGLLQTRAYRYLNQETATILSKYSITPVEWAFLGMLYDQKDIQPKIAAKEFGVEPPFITSMFKKLQTQDLVDCLVDPKDNRAKVICLSKKGRIFMKENEPIVLDKMRLLIEGIPRSDIVTYLSVLEAISNNAKKLGR